MAGAPGSAHLSPAWRLLGAGVLLIWLAGAVVGRWGVAWLRSVPRVADTALAPCVLRSATGLPCPLCGATRSLELATRGAWGESLAHHPFGLAFLVVGGAVAVWVAIAVGSGRDLGVRWVAAWIVQRARWWWLAGVVAGLWVWQVANAAQGGLP